MKFIIKGTLPNLNDYITACRSNRYSGAKMKNQAENIIAWSIKASKDKKQFDKPVAVRFVWVESNRKRDKDNIAFAKKFIFDALVDCKILKGDGWEFVDSFSDDFRVDSKNPRVEIEIIEVS